MTEELGIPFLSGTGIVLAQAAIFGDPVRDGLEENGRYEYELSSPDYSLKEQPGVIRHSRIQQDCERGSIEPGNYVGLLKLVLVDRESGEEVAVSWVEVRSRKLSYEDEYRKMLEEVADRCADFLLQLESPVEQRFRPEDSDHEATLAQRLYFLKSLLGGEDFQTALQRIVSMPNTRWREEHRLRDVRNSKRLGRHEVRQFASASRRVAVPSGHPLRSVLASVPEQIEVRDKRDTVDTPENRFVKHALRQFLHCLEELLTKFGEVQTRKYPGLAGEIGGLIDGLEEVLSHEVFKQVSLPALLPLNSPVLQRKEGYRQVLRNWMLFELAARLSWEGGEDVYAGGKRDAAALYEYWVFFKMLDLVAALFELDSPPVESLINDRDLVLKLKAGKHLAIEGSYDGAGRRLKIQFSYNRTFPAGRAYPAGGSWTRQMRPDYTLSLWPTEFSQDGAERQELISHVHFDAKYKVDRLVELFGEDGDPGDEEEASDKNSYKRTDLLKMHAYRDAIRRSAGAYVLYPGADAKEQAPFQGFHELLPGLGAFPLRPDSVDDGTAAITRFLKEVVAHVCNRASQYEQQTWQTYRIHKGPPPDQVREALPETAGDIGERGTPAAETPVLVGYCKSEDHIEWIQKHALYNFRTGSGPGSLSLGPGVSDARYLLLHGPGELETSRLYRVKGEGPKVYARETLEELDYPTRPGQPYYIVYRLEELETDNPLKKYLWDIRKLKGWSANRGSGYPFATTLAELMGVEVKRTEDSGG
ncbi:MAG: DUF2357 domain-containing protein [Kiritimatiellia bacterium]